MSAVAKNKIVILQTQMIKIGGKLGSEVYIKKLRLFFFFVSIKIMSEYMNFFLFLLLSTT